MTLLEFLPYLASCSDMKKKKKKKKAPEIQENTNSHVWQHRTKMTSSDKLFLLLSFMKKKCKYKDEKFLGWEEKGKTGETLLFVP